MSEPEGMNRPEGVENLLRSLHPTRGRVELPTAAHENGDESADGRAETAPAVAPQRGLDMYERDMLETVSRFVEATGLGYHLGSAVERILRAPAEGREGTRSLREAMWLLERHMGILERRPIGADLHVASERLARTGDGIADMKALAAQLEAAVPAPPAPDLLRPQVEVVRIEPADATPVAPAAEVVAERAPIVAPSPDGAPSQPAADAGVESDAPGRRHRFRFKSSPTAQLAVAGAGDGAQALEEDDYSLRREVAVMAVRWALMVAAVVAIVLVATLIADGRY